MLDGLSLELYRYAVAHPGWTKAAASEALGYTLREISTATEALLERRLLNLPAAEAGPESVSAGYVAVSPDVALADLVDEDERTVQEIRARINAQRREMSDLVPAFLEARRDVLSDPAIEVLEDPRVIRRVLIEYGRGVNERVLIAQPGQGSTADVQEESIRKDLDLLRKGVERKTLYDTTIRDHVPTRKAVTAIAAAGGEFRAVPHLPLRVMIFDDKLALVARQLHPGDKAALVVRDANLIGVFAQLFGFAWASAEPFFPDRPGVPELSSTQEAILNGLAAGYSDESIARRLDINVRTCRRHIAWMLEKLRAESRFQAGIKAREAGWI